ncbi:hypothetical protein [Nocardioides solisilvae]|uniref:hypothetical protein n=1 Tax=Nocardioides solisilvae TaxID=1542435 RepID=UPI000D742415|nr:hypothetical protein [Nocardioides solisilvae]
MTSRDSDEVVFRGRAVAPWLWWGTWVAMLAVAFVPPLLDGGLDDGIGDLLVGAFAYGLAWGVPVWVTLITLWSMEFYGRTRLTRTTLQVGRDRMPVADLDPAGVRGLDREQPSIGARLRSSMGDVHLPGSATPEFRYLGGSYGTPIGMDAVSLPLRNGGVVRFYVRDRAALLTAVDRVLAGG